MTRLVFYDLETSGLDRERHSIIQLAAVAVDRDFRKLGRFERKLRFNVEAASPEALKLNSYSAKAWGRDAVPPARALGDFADWLREYADVELISKRTGKPYRVALGAGHNVRSFDHDWLRRAYKRHGLFLPMAYRPLDTRELAEWWQWQQPEGLENLQIGTLCAFFGVEVDGAHDAEADAEASAKLAACLLDEMSKAGVIGTREGEECEECQGEGFCLDCGGDGRIETGVFQDRKCDNCSGTGICPGCGKGGKT